VKKNHLQNWQLPANWPINLGRTKCRKVLDSTRFEQVKSNWITIFSTTAGPKNSKFYEAQFGALPQMSCQSSRRQNTTNFGELNPIISIIQKLKMPKIQGFSCFVFGNQNLNILAYRIWIKSRHTWWGKKLDEIQIQQAIHENHVRQTSESG
jgi:hypothetical protein